MFMEINLKEVPIRSISYEGDVEIPKEYYEKMDIIDIEKVHLQFEIFKNADQEDLLHLKSTGTFILQDARDLKEVPYPFQFEFTEKLAE